jgi:hypothetical protein
MYHIKDKENAIKLIRTAADVKTKINSVFFDDDENDETTKNIFDELEIKENVPIDELLKLNESCIVIYNTTHLNNQLIDLMNHNIKPLINKCKTTLITKMTIPKTKKLSFIYLQIKMTILKILIIRLSKIYV